MIRRSRNQWHLIGPGDQALYLDLDDPGLKPTLHHSFELGVVPLKFQIQDRGGFRILEELHDKMFAPAGS